jgi:hypothetical protein
MKEDMPQIQAWKCPKTEKLFEEKTKYLNHLRALAKASAAKRKERKMLGELQSVFTRMRTECGTMEEIEEFIKAHWSYFMLNLQMHSPIRKNRKAPDLTHIKLEVGRALTCSNSHSAPIGEHSQFTNSQMLPGFKGSIQFGTATEVHYFNSYIFNNTGINLGSGGGSHKDAKYEITLWEKDWPKLTANRNMEMVAAKLSIL